MPFTYKTDAYGTLKTSRIEREQAETVLKMAREAGLKGPNSMFTRTLPGEGYKQHHEEAWKAIPAIVEFTKDFPDFWTLDVSAIEREQYEVEREQRWLEAAARIEHPGIRAYVTHNILAKNREVNPDGGFAKPQEFPVVDLTSWGTRAKQSKRPYQPQPGCSMKLKMRQAVRIGSTQEAYADHSYFLIPVEGEIGNLSVCSANLRAFAESIRTATGIAGVGSTYSMNLFTHDGFNMVIVNVRSSIAD